MKTASDFASRTRGVLAGAVTASLVLSSVSVAQLVPSVPEKTPETPAYEPPPPPPPPPERPRLPQESSKPGAEAEPLPSIIERDADGNFELRRDMSKYEAALRAFEWDEETQVKVEAVIAEHDADIERFVHDHIELVGELISNVSDVESIEDMSGLMRVRQMLSEIPEHKVHERALKEGAITFVQKRRIDEVIKEYETAYKESLQERFGQADPTAAMAAYTRDIFFLRTQDYFDALDRMLEQVQADGAEFVSQIEGVTAEQWSSAVAAAKGEGGDGLEAVRRAFFSVLSVEQQQRLLELVNPKLAEPQQTEKDAVEPEVQP